MNQSMSELYQMLERVTGGDPQTELPLHVLQTVCRHVSTISKRNVPKVVAQKRCAARTGQSRRGVRAF